MVKLIGSAYTGQCTISIKCQPDNLVHLLCLSMGTQALAQKAASAEKWGMIKRPAGRLAQTDPEVRWTNRNMEWMVTAGSAPLLLFLLVRCLHIPVEEELGSNEAVTEGGDHKGASHEGISRFLNGGEDSCQGAPKEQKNCDG